MLYKGLKSFTGPIAFYENQIKDLADSDTVRQLVHDKYIEPVKTLKKEKTPEPAKKPAEKPKKSPKKTKK